MNSWNFNKGREKLWNSTKYCCVCFFAVVAMVFSFFLLLLFQMIWSLWLWDSFCSKTKTKKNNIFSNGRENAVEHWSVCILCYRHFKNIRLVHWEYICTLSRVSLRFVQLVFFARSVYLSTYKIPFDLNLYSFSYSIWFFVCFSFSYLNFLVFNMMNTMLIGIESYLTYITYNKIKITTETGWIRNEFVVIFFFSRYFSIKNCVSTVYLCVKLIKFSNE